MPLEVDISRTPCTDWNNRILSGHSESLLLYHTTLWAERFKKLAGYTPYYITVSNSGSPLLALLAMRIPLIQPYALSSWRDYLSLAKRIGLGPRKTYGWHGQPVILGVESDSAYAMLAQALLAFETENKMHLDFGQWPTSFGHVLPDKWQGKCWGTYKIDLSVAPEESMAGFKNAARKAIKKSWADNITVRRLTNLDELKEYFIFAQACAKRYGKTNLYWKDYELCWNCFQKDQGIFETFVAEHDSQIISGLSVYGFAGHIMEIGSFQSEFAFKKKLYGPDLIKWEIIKWGHENHMLSFDLAGVNPTPANTKETNIRRFKEKWGGKYHEFLNLQGVK